MAKQRVVAGFGPGSYRLNNSATSVATVNGSWRHFGPFLGSNFCARAVFSSTVAQNLKVQAVLSETTSPSTGGAVTLVSISSTAEYSHVKSTSAGIFTLIRARSTGIPAKGATTGHTITVHWAALG